MMAARLMNRKQLVRATIQGDLGQRSLTSGREGDRRGRGRRSRNRHRGADQWLYVVSGRGVAKTGRQSLRLRAGTLVLIEHGDRHEIRNTGRTSLKTLNLYVPPAYTPSGEELRRAKP